MPKQELEKTYNPSLIEKSGINIGPKRIISHQIQTLKRAMSDCYSSSECYWNANSRHVLNNTIQDILIRKARMEGKEAC